MTSLPEYAISIIVTALIFAVLSGLLQNSALKGIVNTVFGMILTITVVAPLRNMDFSFSDHWSDLFLNAANSAAVDGEQMSRDALQKIIKQETEAYIQDKAAALHADISAEVILNNGDPPIPKRIIISGTPSPYVKQQLQKILITDLGITKENLEWIG